jgi:hypothetical protein
VRRLDAAIDGTPFSSHQARKAPTARP